MQEPQTRAQLVSIDAAAGALEEKNKMNTYPQDACRSITEPAATADPNPLAGPHACRLSATGTQPPRTDHGAGATIASQHSKVQVGMMTRRTIRFGLAQLCRVNVESFGIRIEVQSCAVGAGPS